MSTAANAHLWDESLDGLLVLWAKGARRREIGNIPEDPAEIRGATLRRAETLAKYTHLSPDRVLRTPRQWQAFWRWEPAWEKLISRLGVYGWSARRAPATVSEKEMERLALRCEGNTVIIAEAPLAERVARVQASGCPYAITLDDMATFALAQELFALAAPKIGNPPLHGWVEEVAPHSFAKLVLGLPFEPLAIELAAAVSARYAPKVR
jgi:hypothetical protein